MFSQSGAHVGGAETAQGRESGCQMDRQAFSDPLGDVPIPRRGPCGNPDPQTSGSASGQCRLRTIGFDPLDVHQPASAVFHGDDHGSVGMNPANIGCDSRDFCDSTGLKIGVVCWDWITRCPDLARPFSRILFVVLTLLAGRRLIGRRLGVRGALAGGQIEHNLLDRVFTWAARSEGSGQGIAGQHDRPGLPPGLGRFQIAPGDECVPFPISDNLTGIGKFLFNVLAEYRRNIGYTFR